MTEPSAVDRLDAAVHRCAEDTASVVVVHWPLPMPRWMAPWWLKLLAFPLVLLVLLRWLTTPRSKEYSYSATGWNTVEKEWCRDDSGSLIYRNVNSHHEAQFRWVKKDHGPGWKCGREVLSTAELLRRLGPGAAQAIVRAIDATYEETQDFAYLAAEVEFKQQARGEILAAERRR